MDDASTMAGKDLAVLGGAPAFAQPLHVGRPNLGERAAFMERVGGIFDRRWLTNNGPLLQEFEARVRHEAGVKHCVAMCNGTVALEIAIRAMGLRGEVIVPAYTFVATAHALQWQQITPVFVDIDPVTQTVDPQAVARAITPQTSGIIGVHLWGTPCDTDALQAVADDAGLPLMYDAAHAFACSRQGRRVGGFGACEVFSFHATKFVNCFEGGAVVTDDDALSEKMRLMRNFGFAGYDEVVWPGTNGKMSEVCAAMGLTSLEAMPEIVEVNRCNQAAYRVGLVGAPGLTLLPHGGGGGGGDGGNFQYVVVAVDAERSPLSRDELVAVLHAENVLARKYFWPGCHRMEPYRSMPRNAGLVLPHTEQVAAGNLVLPTGQGVNVAQVSQICGLIQAAQRQAGAVTRALRVESPAAAPGVRVS